MTAYGRSVLVACLGSALAACAQLSPPESAAQPKAAGDAQVVAARQGPPSRFIGLIGARAQHAAPFLGVPETNFYCLRSLVDRQSGETRHQLYVSDSYSGAERGWNAARDGAGHPLRFVEIGRDEITCDGGCSYAEEFAASLPENELQANPQGLAVTFTARSGAEKTIFVPGEQITKQLAAVGAARNPVQPAAALAEPAPPR
jgi:hypothetical protein